ncbi:unnamed protein product [Notodromas monacha]|uniref:Uncharacterized protein n=1 Tax=Notodromas monacha TaxID=399045 RepID=A0A7R9BGY3_9CRUS|nr:unnamed protein product [Notodromas monacha]CAG0914565.1 unnamed protein product [Notodromas monacha]
MLCKLFSAAIFAATFCFACVIAAGTDNELNWTKSLESPWGKELLWCKENWAEISEREEPPEVAQCMHRLLLSVVPRWLTPEGVAQLGIPRLDPLGIGTINIGGNGQPFNGLLENNLVKGITTGLTLEHSSVKYDPVTKEALLVVRIPVPMMVSADYKVNLDTGALFGTPGSAAATTTGHVVGVARDVVAHLNVAMTKARNGELRVRSSRSSFEVQSFELNFKGHNPNDVLTTFLNTALSTNEATQPILDLLKPPVNNFLAKSVGSLYHRGWKVLQDL